MLKSFRSALVACLLSLSLPSVGAETLIGKVVRISDGDTITVLDDGLVMHKVRVEGIDAPEKGQAFGARATQELADLVAGQQVEVDWKKLDRYGRIVGKVRYSPRPCLVIWCAKRDAGLTMIRAGLAWHFKRYQREQTPEDQVEYASAELQARKQREGLWRDADPVAPWEYRGRK